MPLGLRPHPLKCPQRGGIGPQRGGGVPPPCPALRAAPSTPLGDGFALPPPLRGGSPLPIQANQKGGSAPPARNSAAVGSGRSLEKRSRLRQGSGATTSNRPSLPFLSRALVHCAKQTGRCVSARRPARAAAGRGREPHDRGLGPAAPGKPPPAAEAIVRHISQRQRWSMARSVARGCRDRPTTDRGCAP